MVPKLGTEWLIVGVSFLALVGFVIKASNKVLAISYDRYVTILAMQFIAFALMALVVTFKLGWKKVWSELEKLTARHAGLIAVGGIGDLLIMLVSMRLLVTEDIGHLGILDMAIATLLAVGGGYLIFNEKVTPWRVVGMIVIMGGAYLTTM